MVRDSHAAVVRALLLLAAVAVPAALQAGNDTWTSIGPYGPGGNVRAIAVDPVSANTIYVGSDGGVFKSIDGGSSFGGINAGINAFSVNAIAIDPSASGTLYAGTNAGLFKTVNGGNSWSAERTGLGLAAIQSLAIDPANPAVIYAGTVSGGVSKSTDGGITWIGSSNGLTSFNVRTLAIDPSSSSTLYAGTIQGVFKSTDGAASWSAAPGFQASVRVLLIDSSNPSTIYAGTEGIFATTGVFKSTDAGATWVSSNAGLGNVAVLSLATISGQSSTIFAGTQGAGIFVTRDAGVTWMSLVGSPISVNSVALDATGHIVYAGTPEGFFRSTDDGRNWLAMNVSFSTFTVNALIVDPTISTTLYAGVTRPGSSGGGVYKTTNAGATWTSSSNGLPDRSVTALAATSSQTPATLFAGTSDSGVFVSRDSGGSWIASNTGLTAQTINAIAVGGSSLVYLGTNSGVFRSSDGGASWTAASAGLTASSVLALAVNPTSPQVVFAGTPGGVFKSIDGGVDWVASSVGLANVGVLSLAIDPTAPTTIYAGSFSAVSTGPPSGSGVYRSTDGGATWVAANDGIEDLAVTALATDPTGSTVFAGTTQGVYRSARGTSTWTGVNDGLSLQTVSALAVDPALPKRVYAGTTQTSVFQIVFSAGAGACTAGPQTLCLNGNRFQVEVDWRAPLIGTSGVGMAIPLTSDTGAFWFFTSGNVELVIKVVDGRPLNHSFWVFYGAMSNVAYTITVTDTLTATKKVYENPQGQLASVADTFAFPETAAAVASPSSAAAAAASSPLVETTSTRATLDGPCVADTTSLCLNANRFRVTLHWSAANIGTSGEGQAVPLSSDSGSFWFFSAGNLELNIKVVDGTTLNNHFWVFYGALSNVAYTITVTDTTTGTQRTYSNPQGQLASVADTAAF